MKQIYVNLKRFDVPVELAGVNRIASVENWGAKIFTDVQAVVSDYVDRASFTLFFPEAHILNAGACNTKKSQICIGCQGVYCEDVQAENNFGAFTSNRPAAAAKALGCGAVIIGHCEERQGFANILKEAGVNDSRPIDRILNRETVAAMAQGLRVLYCIGENAAQKDDWQQVLTAQLKDGLDGISTQDITIAYEPVWAIGPGKTPPSRDEIQKVAQFIKRETKGLPLVYGGGLKSDNASMLASIPEIDGGLVALTRFTGEIGFYPSELAEIIKLYLGENGN